jgi:hypothetical protein
MTILVDQHEVLLGLTNTVLLCIALEYYEIAVSCILFCFFFIYGFTNKFSW